MKPSARAIENQNIKQLILSIYTDTKFRLGASKIQVLLLREHGINISVGRVYRLMKSMQLPKISTVKPVFRHSKSTDSLTCNNLVNQQFTTSEPNKVWLSDISYIPVKNGFVYLCVIIDLFSRKIIAWNVYESMSAKLVCDTLEKAVTIRKPEFPVIFHSDRGTQYLSLQVRQLQDKLSIVPSYSKVAHPWDNAVTESFFKWMKHE